ncbi:MAG: type I-E CRISPR-associated protein Cas6/Cse3/CasE [Chloroflexi bacterium]|nr:type I-E CRISPR-associated protein Cas6/Cse3/CasE [Chloroflexota bacterium]
MNLYLSRLVLNPRSRRVMSEMAHPYEMHRTLMCAFPEATDKEKAKAREEFGVLFRADVDDRKPEIKVYVQSRLVPNWSFLDGLDDYLAANAEMPDPKPIMQAYQKLRNGQILAFSLRANPTKRIAKDGDKLKGKRVELQSEQEQIDWLIRKGQGREEGAPGGFELVMKEVEDADGALSLIPCVDVRPEGKQKGYKRDGEQRQTTTHLAVLFEGLLRVTDTDAFLETIRQGIGPAKAYGFGLLSIAPHRG